MLSAEEMLTAGAHFGYSCSSRHPKMKSFIFTSRNDTEIFDIEKTKNKLAAAKEFLKNLAKEKKTLLFVGTKKEAQKSIETSAKDLNMPYVRERWLGGTLTNFKEIKNRIDFLNDLLKKKSSGELEKYTKKERLQIERKIIKLEKYLKGLQQCRNLPFALIAVDSNYEKTAVQEARQMNIPVIALMNSDCNPEDADYFIPANDSSVSSINYFLSEFVKGYKEGYDNSGAN
jgi:small subunit ribosomal protein S2